MRLNNFNRDKIVKEATRQAFAKREAEIDAFIGDIGDRAYIALFDAKTRKLMKTLDRNFVVSSLTCKFAFFKKPSSEEASKITIRFSKEQPVPRGTFNSYEGVDVPAELILPFIAELDAVGKKKTLMDREKYNFAHEVKGVVYNCPTSAKLFAVWPEIQGIMGIEFWRDTVKDLPSINVANLNAQIAAGKPVPKEQVAA